MQQTSFSSAEYAAKRRQTRRERFLVEMNAVVPWTRLETLIEPHYPKTGRAGRPPISVARMLRMYFLQHWYTLSDEALEDALYDGQAMREFVGMDLGRVNVPDATTLLKFWRLVEQHDLTVAILAEVNAQLSGRGLQVGQGTPRGAICHQNCLSRPHFQKAWVPRCIDCRHSLRNTLG